MSVCTYCKALVCLGPCMVPVRQQSHQRSQVFGASWCAAHWEEKPGWEFSRGSACSSRCFTGDCDGVCCARYTRPSRTRSGEEKRSVALCRLPKLVWTWFSLTYFPFLGNFHFGKINKNKWCNLHNVFLCNVPVLDLCEMVIKQRSKVDFTPNTTRWHAKSKTWHFVALHRVERQGSWRHNFWASPAKNRATSRFEHFRAFSAFSVDIQRQNFARLLLDLSRKRWSSRVRCERSRGLRHCRQDVCRTSFSNPIKC